MRRAGWSLGVQCGENEDSCFVDCLGGPCETVVDCFAHRWYEDFGGHWQCNPAMPPEQLSTGACEAVRDDFGCGDATCDVLGGETPVACVADCSDYSPEHRLQHTHAPERLHELDLLQPRLRTAM